MLFDRSAMVGRCFAAGEEGDIDIVSRHAFERVPPGGLESCSGGTARRLSSSSGHRTAGLGALRRPYSALQSGWPGSRVRFNCLCRRVDSSLCCATIVDQNNRWKLDA